MSIIKIESRPEPGQEIHCHDWIERKIYTAELTEELFHIIKNAVQFYLKNEDSRGGLLQLLYFLNNDDLDIHLKDDMIAEIGIRYMSTVIKERERVEKLFEYMEMWE